ncbi:hypothetical protein M0802_003751 [Mischocyttarus mexicanus]|nr:hypothetical protein M0802_003751 [Mischocyttarus mexicanus]
MATRIASVSGVLLTLNLMLHCLLTDAGKVEDIVKESSGGLPFLQFTDGGIRLNFAGYHAEAGLGGLLGNSRTGGGLHASAGTPFGPQASAGLGGLLNGDNANAGGGLYAQAGLGNDRPSARAGLGGILDGSGRSNYPAAGGLFANAGLGNNQPSAGTGLEGTLGGNAIIPSSNNDLSNNPPTSGHTNIQVISKSATKIGHKSQREIARKSIIINEAVPESKYDTATLYRNLNDGVNTGDVVGKSAVENVEKNTINSPVSGLVSAKGVVETGANVDVAVGNNFKTTQEPPIINRWYLRKRLRGGPLRKQVIRTSSVIPVSAPISAPAIEIPSATASSSVSAKSSGNVITRFNADASSAGSDVSYVSTKTYKPGSLFDDIFNIPISTLTAVNQLLRNNADDDKETNERSGGSLSDLLHGILPKIEAGSRETIGSKGKYTGRGITLHLPLPYIGYNSNSDSDGSGSYESENSGKGSIRTGSSGESDKNSDGGSDKSGNNGFSIGFGSYGGSSGSDGSLSGSGSSGGSGGSGSGGGSSGSGSGGGSGSTGSNGGSEGSSSRIGADSGTSGGKSDNTSVSGRFGVTGNSGSGTSISVGGSGISSIFSLLLSGISTILNITGSNNVASVINDKSDFFDQELKSLENLRYPPSIFSRITNSRETVHLENESEQSLAEKTLGLPFNDLLINFFNPTPLVDQIKEEEKYGNTADKTNNIGRSFINGFTSFNNLINSAVGTAQNLKTKFGRNITDALNQIGGKLVGLQ